MLQRDLIYRKGRYIYVSGSVGVMATGQPPALGATLKVVVNEVSGRDLSRTPAAPTRAFIVGRNFSTNAESLVSTIPSDTPGGLFSIYQISPSIDYIMDALETHRLTIAFDKAGGSSDIQSVIETDVASVDDNGNRTRSLQAELEFANCIVALTRR